MQCAWKELLSILPPWIRCEVDRLGKAKMQSLRLRIHGFPEIVTGKGSLWLTRRVTEEDLSFCVNTASRYSPWAASTISRGYLTAPGGHRIGLCGEGICHSGVMTGFQKLTSLCIRVARDFSGIAQGIPEGSLLILGAPGWGKTTLLRDLIRRESEKGYQIAVVDERGELFPREFSRGKCTDVITNFSKELGIPALLRTMGPDMIAVDEITEEVDCKALLNAFGCGVKLLATAHAASVEDFARRQVYATLLSHKVFHTAVILRRDKSWYTERMA